MIKLNCGDSVENLQRNHENNKGTTDTIHKYRRLRPRPKVATAIIVAPGTSAPQSYLRIKEACDTGKAHVFSVKTNGMLEQAGITPHFAVHIDSKQAETEKVFLNPRTKYFVSTQCHPDVFDKLKGHKVYQFHSRTSSEWKPRGYVASGSNTTVQAMCIARFLGYTKLIIVGFDCSWPAEKDSHVYGHRKFYTRDKVLEIELPDGTLVHTNPILVGAAQEAARLFQIFAKDQNLEVVGTMFAQKYIQGVVNGDITLPEP